MAEVTAEEAQFIVRVLDEYAAASLHEAQQAHRIAAGLSENEDVDTYPLDDPHDDDGNRITVPEDQREQAAAPERGAGVMKPFGLTYEGDAPWWILGPALKVIADDEFDDWVVEVQYDPDPLSASGEVSDLVCNVVSVDLDGDRVVLQPWSEDTARATGDPIKVALTQVVHVTVP